MPAELGMYATSVKIGILPITPSHYLPMPIHYVVWIQYTQLDTKTHTCTQSPQLSQTAM